jgi:ketosteroid isomerase-like protein
MAALAALMGCPCMAQSGDSIESRNKAIVKASFEAWASGAGSPYDLLADDASWSIVGHSAASKTYPSKEAFLREVIRPFNARMSGGLKPTIRDIYAEGDTVIVFFDASGTARDGRPFANTYAWFLDLENGKVMKASAFFDSIVFNDFWQRVEPDPSKSRKE